MFDESEFDDNELKDMADDDGGVCSTEKDKYQQHQRNGGCLIATSHCGIVYQARELWRSEGKQQVKTFLCLLLPIQK